MTLPVSIRFCNPGAVNVASWVRAMPGFIEAVETTRGNRTARFRTFEQGVAAWWELMRRYRDAGAQTVGTIITKYGGSGQNYEEYVRTVVTLTGFKRSTTIDIHDDSQLLRFAKAMFAVEAGRAAWEACRIPDARIIEGFRQGRIHAGVPAGEPKPAEGANGLWGLVLRVLRRVIR